MDGQKRHVSTVISSPAAHYTRPLAVKDKGFLSADQLTFQIPPDRLHGLSVLSTTAHRRIVLAQAVLPSL